VQRRDFVKSAMCLSCLGLMNSGCSDLLSLQNDEFKDFDHTKSRFYYKSVDELPKTVRLEACSLCQLKCPECKVRKLEKDAPKDWLGYLKFSDFKKFVDKHSFLEEIHISNNGEIFINPELDEIMKYAYEKGITLSAGNGVNFNDVKETTLENLVKYQFRFMAIAIDGATQETYAKYRVGGDINKVFENIKKVNYYKEKYDSYYPRMVYQYIVFGHNEHEIELAKKIAQELKIKFKFKRNYALDYSPVKRVQKIVDDLPRRNPDTDCDLLFNTPQIDYNGNLLGCCAIQYGHFGINVFKEGLLKALNKKNVIYAKHMLTDLTFKPAKNILCTTCSIYKQRKKQGKVMEIS